MAGESEWLARMQAQAERTRQAYVQCSIARSAIPRDEAAVLEAVENCWYILSCISFGAGYFLKLPMARALCDADEYTITSAGNFWYILRCIPFGAAYMQKVTVK